MTAMVKRGQDINVLGLGLRQGFHPRLHLQAGRTIRTGSAAGIAGLSRGAHQGQAWNGRQ